MNINTSKYSYLTLEEAVKYDDTISDNLKSSIEELINKNIELQNALDREERGNEVRDEQLEFCREFISSLLSDLKKQKPRYKETKELILDIEVKFENTYIEI
jgi:hypothetical protein